MATNGINAEEKNSFLEKSGFFGNTEETVEEVGVTETAEVTIEEPTEQTTGQESPTEEVHEEESFFTPFFEETVEEPEPVQQAEEVKVKDKVKYNLKDYVEEYKDTLRDYFTYKNLDPSTMSNTDLIKFKLKNDNPSWSDEDISAELQDSYGIGLKEKEIPIAALDEEIEEINSYNERIREKVKRGERLLKAEVDKAKNILKQKQESLELPEVDLEVELSTDPTKVIEQYTNQQIEQNKKFLEEQWIPNIKEAVAKVGGFRQPLEIEVQQGDKVVSELNYKLTDKQKEILTDYMSNYSAHPSDEKYILDKETGAIDFTRLVSDKAKQLFADDIIRASVKDALAQFKDKFVKENIVNFSDEPRRVTKSSNQQKDFAIGHFEAFKQKQDSLYGKR